MSKENQKVAKVQDVGKDFKPTVLEDSSVPVKEGARDEKGNAIKPIRLKYDAAAEIKKFGVAPTEVIEYKDPFTDQIKKIMVDRRGTTDEKLALALLDEKVSREQKDTMISMYLFEKGKQGASMLMDLWQYKGQHTKESRQFQSQMRFDFELFLQVFQIFMQDSADLIFHNLPVEVAEVEVEDVDKQGNKRKVKKEIVRMRENAQVDEVTLALTLGEIGRYFRMTSTLMGQRIRSEVQKRERAKGKGIYIGLDNKPYSVYEDGDVVEVVKKDREQALTEIEERAQWGERVKAGQCVTCGRPVAGKALHCKEHEQK